MLEGPRVDLEQKLSLFHGLVFLDVDVHHLAFDPGRHLNDVGLDVGVGGEGRVAIRQDVIGDQGRDHQQEEQDPGPRRPQELPTDDDGEEQRRQQDPADAAEPGEDTVQANHDCDLVWTGYFTSGDLRGKGNWSGSVVSHFGAKAPWRWPTA